MFNIHNVRPGDIVALGGYMKRKWKQSFITVKYGIVVTFTQSGIPRAMQISNWEHNSKNWDYEVIRYHSAIVINPSKLNNQQWQAIIAADNETYKGNLEKNYNTLLKLVRYGESKNKDILDREQKEINLSSSLLDLSRWCEDDQNSNGIKES